MSTSQQTDRPNSSASARSEPLIAIRLRIPEDGAIDNLVFPKHNRIGTTLLSSLLESAIKAAGVGIASPNSHGFLELNKALWLLNVTELGPALTAIRAELGRLGLLGVAHIAWHDSREGIFRPFYPEGGEFPMPTDEEREAEQKVCSFFDEAVRRFRSLQ